MTENFWLKLKRPFSVLAPMEDVTDLCFRSLIARYHRPDVFFTEFASTDGLFSPGRGQVAIRLDFEESEQPIVAQIWGNNPDRYLQAAKLLRDMGFAGIDINMGCPVHKVVRRGECSGLIGNETLARELIGAAREGSGGLPISVKTRLGIKKPITEDWFAFLLAQDLAAITVHGRIASELSHKPAAWDEIRKVVDMRNASSLSTLIIGNGDVESYADLTAKAAESLVDGVMIGRGVFNNLFIFDPSGRRFVDLSPSAKLEHLLLHLKHFEDSCERVEKRWGRKPPFKNLRKFFKIYAQGFPGAADLRDILVRVETLEEARAVTEAWLGRLVNQVA